MNISEMAKDMAIYTYYGNRNSYAVYQMVPFPMTLNEP